MDINCERPDVRTDGSADTQTENWMSISHPAEAGVTKIYLTVIFA